MADSDRDERRNRDRKLILHEVDDRVESRDFRREVRSAGGGPERHAGRRADHGDSRGRGHPDALQNRVKRDKEQHRETGGARDHHHEKLTDEVPEHKHDVRAVQFPKRRHRDADKRVRGTDPFHISREAAGRHDEESDP